eukprot:jgi/Picsp_1/4418/NSC_06640-R1_protein
MKRDRYGRKSRRIHPKQKYPSLLLDSKNKDSHFCYTRCRYAVAFIVITIIGLHRTGERGNQAEEDADSILLTLDIHLLLYERLDSASLLLRAISQPKYPNSTDLYIHVDRSKNEEKHREIEALAHDFNWKFGSKFIISPKVRQGLKKSWLSINPDCNNVDGIAVFEDDILPSGGWFLWTSFILSKHAKSTQVKDSILGVSLSSLKLNELKFPFETWFPGISQDYYHLHQTPSSWGSVLLCRPWQEFREYAAARMEDIFEIEEIGGVSLEGGRPGDPNFHIQELHSNWWSASWKKYMVEFVYAKGMLTVYPNLRLQNIGLVLSLARDGEHMKDGRHGRNRMFEETELASFPDILDAIHLSKSSSLDDTMLFDIHFQSSTLKRMKQNGLEYINSLVRKGPPYSEIASFFPQNSNFAMRKEPDYKYLGYMPHRGQGNQLNSLAKAISLSIILKRILLVPHIFLPSKSAFNECSDDEFCLEISDVLSLNYVSKKRKDLDFVILTAGNFRLFRPDRIYTTDNCTKNGAHGDMYRTYFRQLPTVQLKDYEVKSVIKKRDRVLFLDDITPISMPGSLVQSLGRELYYPNTRLRRVMVDLMEYLGLVMGQFSCLHVPIKHLKSVCHDEDLFRTNALYTSFWNQGYSCLPSRQHVSSLISKNISSKQIFISTDNYDQLRNFLEEAWDSQEIKSSRDTREYLGLRFPNADRKFIEALHVFIDQYFCILAENTILSRFSMFSYQVQLNRYDKRTDFWLQERDG